MELLLSLVVTKTAFWPRVVLSSRKVVLEAVSSLSFSSKALLSEKQSPSKRAFSLQRADVLSKVRRKPGKQGAKKG